MSLIYNATFDKNTRKLSFEDRAGNEIYSFTVPERVPAVDDITKPLTFRATQDGSTVKLTKYHSPTGEFQTSRDGGNTWEDYRLGSRITLNTGDKVSFRAKADRTSAQNTNNYFYFMMAGKIEAWHNVMSMLRPSDFATYNIRIGFAFYHLFENCGSLTKAPILPATTFVQDPYQGMFLGCISLTKAPELPATTLSPGCYSYMFEGCRSLTEAPELPATTLPILCYYRMFEGCQSLTKAPELPATTLDQRCYGSMFQGCQSLKEAPVLPATTLAWDCYSYMFSGCQSLTEAPELPATTLAQDCYRSMFQGCQSLTKAPELPATTLKTSCYDRMFEGCQSLTKAPVLPATTLADGCYKGMFSGCGSLNEVRCKMPSTISAGDIPKYTGDGSDTTKPAWLNGVASTGTFYTNAGANWSSGASGIPQNWTRVNEDDIAKPLTFKATQDGSTVSLTKKGSPAGAFQTSTDGGSTWTDYTLNTAITLNTGDEVSFRAKADRTSADQNNQNYFNFEMTGKIEAWHNVMSMIRTSDFATYKSVVESGLRELFRDCKSLTKAPVLPATTLANDCYEEMFYGCQSLKEAPELPATTLVYGCYARMFCVCESLTKAPALPATTLADYCYYFMFQGCRSLTKAPELPATTLAKSCYTTMFQGCQSLKEVRIAATTTADNALESWLSAVSATGDFYCDPNATIFPSGASGIPQNWTRHNIADYPTT